MNKSSYLLALLLIIACTCAVYSNHFNNEFHFDDSHTIQNNLYIRNVKNIPLYFQDARTFSNLPQNQSYRPVVSTSLALDYWLGKGYTLFYFHLSSFILFLAQGILMLFFIMKIFTRSDKDVNNKTYIFLTACFALTWYMIHPANAETINYVIARSDLQSTFFVILAFVLYIYSSFSRKTFLYLLPVVVGALAKPTAIMFAPLFFFYVMFFEEKLSITNLFERASYEKLLSLVKKTLPAFIICALLYVFIDRMTPPTWLSGGRSASLYLITQPFVITHYFSTFFLPVGLSADTDWGTLENIWNIRFFAGLAFIISMITIAYYCSTKEILRPISFGILWFFISLLPTSSIIPFSEVLNYHRVFFPYVGLAISSCWTASLLLKKYTQKVDKQTVQYSTAIASVLFLSSYAYGAHARNKIWRTEESLWYDVTVKSPGNGRGLMNYGLVKMATGDYVNAEKYFVEAFKTMPYYSSLYINMGVLKNATGDKIAAERFLKKGIEFGKDYPASWFFYGNFLCSSLRYTEAVPILEQAVNLSPSYLSARVLLMKAYNETGQADKLNKLTRETLQIDPGNTETMQFMSTANNNIIKIKAALEDLETEPSAEKYFQLSLLFYNTGKFNDCVTAANSAIKLKPAFAEAYNNLGLAYNQLRQYDKATAMWRKALSIKPGFQLAENNLSAVMSIRNQIAQAEFMVQQKPTAENYINLSVVYYNHNMFLKCIAACNDALTLKPGFDLAYNNICLSYNQLGEWEKAIIAGEKGLQINPDNALLKNNLAESRQRKMSQKEL